MYHSSMMGGHVGITKCYQTISQRFYCPNLAEQLRAYITGCHVCQLFKKGKKFDRPLKKRVNINVPAMTKISMDINICLLAMDTHTYWCYCVKCQIYGSFTLHSTKTPTFYKCFKRVMLHTSTLPHILCVIRMCPLPPL